MLYIFQFSKGGGRREEKKEVEMGKEKKRNGKAGEEGGLRDS